MFECRHQPLQLPDDVANELAAVYAEPQRAYHNATHIAELLGWFDRVGDDLGWQDPARIYATILFHDAIYVPGAKDNEARSADWARRAGFGDDVASLILLTASHGHNDVVPDRDAALFLDADMAIVGAPPAQFAAYDAAIGREYSHIPADAFRAGRRAFLAGLAPSRASSSATTSTNCSTRRRERTSPARSRKRERADLAGVVASGGRGLVHHRERDRAGGVDRVGVAADLGPTERQCIRRERASRTVRSAARRIVDLVRVQNAIEEKIDLVLLNLAGVKRDNGIECTATASGPRDRR